MKHSCLIFPNMSRISFRMRFIAGAFLVQMDSQNGHPKSPNIMPTTVIRLMGMVIAQDLSYQVRRLDKFMLIQGTPKASTFVCVCGWLTRLPDGTAIVQESGGSPPLGKAGSCKKWNAVKVGEQCTHWFLQSFVQKPANFGMNGFHTS